MRSLTFTCPQTGRAVDAGVTTDLRSLSSVQEEMMWFQLSTLRNDPSVSHKKRLPGRAPLLALHQSLSEPPRALGSSMTVSARCWRGGSPRQQRAESPLFLLSPT